MTTPLLLLSLFACADGPSEETLVSDLQVIATVAEPPEVAPGEQVSLRTVVADPQERGAEVLTWLCTPVGGACLEASQPLDQWVHLGASAEDSASLVVSPALGAALTQTDEVAAVAWVLACEPGLCPVVEEARADLEQGVLSPDLGAALSDPVSWMADLPIAGVSLALRTVPVSLRTAEERNANPVLRVTGPEGAVLAEGLESLEVEVEDQDQETTVYGLATAGGFGSPFSAVLGGTALLSYYAPAETVPATLYVVAQDGRGGTAVWTGEAQVR
ncbi:MAG: hypothetical protein JXX28_13255 [Deltaproteobacteria bacterium]|nr:hypothetical protein [Deltaproteobacteria bacterium]